MDPNSAARGQGLGRASRSGIPALVGSRCTMGPRFVQKEILKVMCFVYCAVHIEMWPKMRREKFKCCFDV